MIVTDTSALVSLGTADVLDLVLEEFDVHTTTLVVDELEEVADHDDVHADAASGVLERIDDVTVHDVEETSLMSSRIDAGEASCLALERDVEADFLLTDDLRALPELESVSRARVVIPPIVLTALVERDVITSGEATTRLDQLAESRDWLGAPIYRRARQLFEEGR